MSKVRIPTANPYLFMHYELYLRARLKQQGSDLGFDLAFARTFSEVFPDLSDRQAYDASYYSTYSVEQGLSFVRWLFSDALKSETLPDAKALRLLVQTQDYLVYKAIMPASVRVGEDGYLVSIRCRERSGENERNWIDLYRSDDGARSWSHIARPAEETGIGGNPPAMIRLKDGRICLVYGFRDSPSGMRATLSSDDGATWQETVLRDDGGNHDVGYPRAVQRPDGSVVAVYYYNDTSDGERYVAATIWRP